MNDEKDAVRPTQGDGDTSSDTEPATTAGHDRYSGGDEALRLVGENKGSIVIDEVTNRRLLRRIDTTIMPFLCIVYGLNYLDKTTLSYASITGFQQDLQLKGDQYQWLGSIFYLAFLGFEYVAVRLLQRLPLGKYSGSCIVLWGIAVASFAAAQDFADAAVIRVILGILEASTSAGWTLFTSQWYRKEEQGIRTAWWVSFNGLAQIFGGVVAYGIAHGASVHGYTLSPWKIIYLFTGALTVVVGVVFLLVIPDSQANAWWLSPADRILAIERVRSNQQGIGNTQFKMYQFREALLDPITWAFLVMALANDVPNGGLSNFFSILLESFGLDAQQSLLYGCVSGAIEFAALLAWAYASKMTNNRLLCGLVFPVIALVGSGILVGLPLDDNKGRLAGFYIIQAFIPGLVAVISLISTNVAGYTKKTTVAGLFFIAYCAGNVIGPQTFRPKDAPQYRPAKITLVVCWAVSIIDLLFIYFWYRRQNRKKLAIRTAPGYQKLNNQEFLDLTDGENAEFVYTV